MSKRSHAHRYTQRNAEYGADPPERGEVGRIPKSEIFDHPALAAPVEADSEMSARFNDFRQQIEGMGEGQINEFLQRSASTSAARHDALCDGLFYGCLTGKDTTQNQFLKRIQLFARDKFHRVVYRLNNFTSMDCWPTVKKAVKLQILRVTDILTGDRAPNIADVYLNLIRNIQGAQISPENAFMAESVLSLFTGNEAFLHSFQGLMLAAMYVYLRLILDHERLAQKSQYVKYCIHQLRKSWDLYCKMGRDLLRALQDLATVPEFEELWKDVLFRPTRLSRVFSGPADLVTIKTSPLVLSSRLTPRMESKLLFILEQCPRTHYTRNVDWFVSRYLNVPECGPLFCDILRYIVCVYHPTNEVIGSHIVQRWEVIAALIFRVKTESYFPSVKQCIFFDWLFFDPNIDSIMLIEPGALMLSNFLDRDPKITMELFEFIYMLVNEYNPAWVDQLRNHVELSMWSIREKGVVQNVEIFLKHPGLLPPARTIVGNLFGRVVQGQKPKTQELTGHLRRPQLDSKVARPFGGDVKVSETGIADDTVILDVDTEVPVAEPPEFSPTIPGLDNAMDVGGDGTPGDARSEDSGDQGHAPITPLASKIRELSSIVATEFRSDSRRSAAFSKASDTLEQIINDIVESGEDIGVAAKQLHDIMKSELDRDVAASSVLENIQKGGTCEESKHVTLPDTIFSAMVKGAEGAESHNRQQGFLDLVKILHSHDSRYGAGLLLHVMRFARDIANQHGIDPFLEFASQVEETVMDGLAKAMRTLSRYHPSVFYSLIPSLYGRYDDYAFGNFALLQIILGAMDGNTLVETEAQMSMKRVRLFKLHQLPALLKKSQGWEVYEQEGLWMLVAAQLNAELRLETDELRAILDAIDFNTDHVHLSGLLNFLRQQPPRDSVILAFMAYIESSQQSLSSKPAHFLQAILKHWSISASPSAVTSLLSRTLRSRFIDEALPHLAFEFPSDTNHRGPGGMSAEGVRGWLIYFSAIGLRIKDSCGIADDGLNQVVEDVARSWGIEVEG